MCGSLFPIVYHASMHQATLAVAYFLQYDKFCVILELDPATPYLVGTLKIIFFKIKHTEYPPLCMESVT